MLVMSFVSNCQIYHDTLSVILRYNIELLSVDWCEKDMHSKMAADKVKAHGLSATASLEETLQSITYFLTYL